VAGLAVTTVGLVGCASVVGHRAASSSTIDHGSTGTAAATASHSDILSASVQQSPVSMTTPRGNSPLAAYYSPEAVCALISQPARDNLVPGGTAIAVGATESSVSCLIETDLLLPQRATLALDVTSTSRLGSFASWVAGEGVAGRVQAPVSELGAEAVATYVVESNGSDDSRVIWRTAGFQLEFAFYGRTGDQRQTLIQLAEAMPG
jgi:hypothetical protein